MGIFIKLTDLIKNAIFSIVFLWPAFLASTALAANQSKIIPCDGVDCNVCHVYQLISNVIQFATFSIAAPLAAIILVYGGFKLITSGGNSGEKEKGMGAIWAAVWGIIIVFAAWMIVNVVIGGLAGKSISDSWYKFPECSAPGQNR